MPRRRWKLRDRRKPLSPALRVYLEVGLGGLLACAKAERPAGYLEAVYFTHASGRAAAWEEYGEEIIAAWAAEHPGTRPWGWWQYVATVPRACVEGAAHVWPLGHGDWVWQKELGLPGRPQLRRPGAEPARLVFESQAAYLRRSALLLPGEAERLTAEDLEPVVVEIPVLTELELVSARPTPRPAPALSPTNGAPNNERGRP